MGRLPFRRKRASHVVSTPCLRGAYGTSFRTAPSLAILGPTRGTLGRTARPRRKPETSVVTCPSSLPTCGSVIPTATRAPSRKQGTIRAGRLSASGLQTLLVRKGPASTPALGPSRRTPRPYGLAALALRRAIRACAGVRASLGTPDATRRPTTHDECGSY